METFDFPYHTVEDQYPSSSAVVQFGGGYSFASKPRGPDQITFKLNFQGMFYFTNSNGTLDGTSNPKINMKVMLDFYENHRLYEPFIYNHPVRGPLTCRFGKPLSIPKGIAKGKGQLEAFQVELILQP